MTALVIVNIGCLIWCIICTALAWHYAHQSERHANRAEAARDRAHEATYGCLEAIGVRATPRGGGRK